MTDRVRDLTVTILADDCVSFGEGVLGEHGLSLLAEADGHSFLLDVGQSGVFLGNAARLCLDLAPARKVVLSHAHYDHTGALPLLLAAYGPREIIGHPDLFSPKYIRQRGKRPRQIGLPRGSEEIIRRGASLSLDSQPQQLFPGIQTTGPIERTSDFETMPSHFAVKSGGRMRRDPFAEEQAVVIHTQQGLVVLVGCSHRGVINALRHAVEMTGDRRVHAMIGGTHLGPASEGQLEQTIAELRRMEVAHIVACHCTGFRAAARLASAFGSAFNPGGVGYQFALRDRRGGG